MYHYARLFSRVGVALALPLFAIVAAACTSGTNANTNGLVQVVAAENFWGSVASQVGGSHVNVTSIIHDPNTDPHDYEPTAEDARTVANAKYVIVNGAGYDPWAENLLEANPVAGRKVLVIADLAGKKEGDNPHLWYDPDLVLKVAGQIRDDLKALDAANAAAYDQSQQDFVTNGLKEYQALINEIKSTYKGTAVGATESIFAYLTPALGLDLITPESYLNAASEGQDISASDQAKVDQQIDGKQIAVLVYNSQNTPPNIQALLDKAKAKGIPVAKVTETPPADVSFQEWQSSQLKGIKDALKQATGK